MDRKVTMADLQFGRTPGDRKLVRDLTVGLTDVSEFIRKEYLASYIREGGSKIKFITGRRGAGKTHLSRLISYDAEDEGYLSVCLDASGILLSDMTNLYLAIFRSVDFDALIEKAAVSVMRELGYDFSPLENGKTVIDWLSDRGENVASARGEIRKQLKTSVSSGTSSDYNYSQIITLKINGYLGLIDIDDDVKAAMDAFLNADTSFKVTKLRAAGLAGYKINRTNARNMIRSITFLARLAGYSGLFVSLDNAETIVTATAKELPVRYTKLRRDDAFEVIRQLIDDIDRFSGFFMTIAFDRVLIDNEKLGMKSYQALWMRVQNEIVSPRINLFADLLDLDRICQQLITTDAIIEMSRRLRELFESENFTAHQINYDEAEAILKESRYGSISIPLLVNRLTLSVKEDSNDRS
ncbi:MAG: BREX system ATP-binding domain-containing protein [Bullifex sp.]